MNVSAVFPEQLRVFTGYPCWRRNWLKRYNSVDFASRYQKRLLVMRIAWSMVKKQQG